MSLEWQGLVREWKDSINDVWLSVRRRTFTAQRIEETKFLSFEASSHFRVLGLLGCEDLAFEMKSVVAELCSQTYLEIYQ